jgi:hypothetical protein
LRGWCLPCIVMLDYFIVFVFLFVKKDQYVFHLSFPGYALWLEWLTVCFAQAMELSQC